jgi:hypothetical protein
MVKNLRNKFSGRIILLALIISMLLIVTVSAQPVYRTDESVVLKVPCTINGTYCSVGATCFATILNPNEDEVFNSAPMIKNGSVFEIYLNQSQKAINGEYRFHILCSDLGNSMSKNLVFEVTPNGEVPTTAKGLLYGGLLTVFVLLMVLALYGGFKTEHVALKTGLFMVAYLFFVGIMFVAWNLSVDYVTSAPFFASMFHLFWLITMIGALPLFLFLLIYTLWMMRQMDIIQNMIDRGMPIDEAYERTVKSGMRGIK